MKMELLNWINKNKFKPCEWVKECVEVDELKSYLNERKMVK